MVGEKGPEIINFKGGESVIPNNRLGGNVININITGNKISNDYDVNRIMDLVVKRLKMANV